MSRASFNQRNPAVKRIQQEMKEMSEQRSADFIAEALETDIFEWHFVVRGPKDSEFEGGVFHGRILLPPDYPFKPPAFMMLSPSGRFETGVKICLSISSHHPEHWQPSWSIRTALTALIAFMPTPGNNALGSLDFTKDERRTMAAASRAAAPKFGSAERQKVSDEMHQRMLDLEAVPVATPALPIKVEPVPEEVLQVQLPLPEPLPSLQPADGASVRPEQDKASGTAHIPPVANVTASMLLDFTRTANGELAAAAAAAAAVPATAAATTVATAPRASLAGEATSSSAAPLLSPHAARSSATAAAAAVPLQARAASTSPAVAAAVAAPAAAMAAEGPSERGLTLLAYALMLAIFAILAKKAFGFWGSFALDLPLLD